MFNWICKKIASYVTVTTPEIDYAKLAEALNINNLANQIVISEEVIAEKIAEKFSASDVAPYVNIKKLANHIDTSEIASNFSEDDIAEKIAEKLSNSDFLAELASDISENDDMVERIAGQFSASDIADKFCVSDIAAEFSTEDIVEGLSFADIAAEISIEDIVAGLSSKDIAAEIPTFAVAEDIMRSKEFVKILVKEITDIMIERLTQQQI